MPDNQHRKDERFAVYDAMSTEELQKVLREDASKPVGEESDTEALFYIMEVLAKRRKERNEGKSPAEALESFKNKYDTEAENSFDSESASVTRKQFNGSRWRKGLVAAAAICILVIGSSITASALGFDPWAVIGKWTQETFHFGCAGQVEETDAPNPEYANPCSGLQDILEISNTKAELIPTWMPDGYVEVEARMETTPVQRRFVARYQRGEDAIHIRIVNYLGDAPTRIEQTDGLIEIYPANGVDYYIFGNNGQLQAAWIIDNMECYISGPITLSEIKGIIDSLKKG